jgi:hypothetical protein
MKKVGVPLTPLRTPPMKSLRTLFLNWPVSSALQHGRFGKPELRADQKNRGDAQPALIFEQGIVHIPKQPRCAGEPLQCSLPQRVIRVLSADRVT